MPTLNYGSIRVTRGRWYVNKKPLCRNKTQAYEIRYYKKIAEHERIQNELMMERRRRGRKSICKNWSKLYKE